MTKTTKRYMHTLKADTAQRRSSKLAIRTPYDNARDFEEIRLHAWLGQRERSEDVRERLARIEKVAQAALEALAAQGVTP